MTHVILAALKSLIRIYLNLFIRNPGPVTLPVPLNAVRKSLAHNYTQKIVVITSL